MGATLGDRLEALGWTLEDDDGAVLPAARAGRRAHLRVAVRTLASGDAHANSHCTFLHVDHAPTRYSVEHRTHAYPAALWRPGDVVIDDFELVLPPHFRAGRYALYWGVGVLPCHDDARMPITSGPDDGHSRVPGGYLEVR
jgi:hypothetical protein